MADYLNAVVTLVVGAIALLVYRLTRRAERRNAAIIVLMDIRRAEDVIQATLQKGFIDMSMRVIMTENNWAKYKHLFADKFSHDDFKAFNLFFDSCYEIEDARRRVRDVFNANLIAKATAVQEMLLRNLEGDDGVRKAKRESIIESVNSEEYAFDPREPKKRIFQEILIINKLSGTTAFEKLKRIAEERLSQARLNS
ncbi:MAG: hypothetical protein JO218_01625 [Burkholderiales bacterium]|nr:hypothetical protein [Burkholderiales bacterium]